MPLSDSEIGPGIIAYFAIDDLRGNGGINHIGGSPDPKCRPFVCYATCCHLSWWTPLTLAKRANKNVTRFVIDPACLVNAVGNFQTQTVLVNDPQHCYCGPSSVFALHSQRCDKFSAPDRPSLTSIGTTSLTSWIINGGGLDPAAGQVKDPG